MYKASILFSILFGLAVVKPTLSETLICTGYQNNTYNPPLTLEERPIQWTFNGVLTCINSNGDGGVTGGAFGGQATLSFGCLTAKVGESSRRVFTWNNGSSSTTTFTATGTSTAGASVFLFPGKITQGLYLGQSVVYATLQTALDPLECLGAGVAQRVVTSTLTIL